MYNQSDYYYFFAQNLYWLALIPILLLSFWAQMQVSGNFRRYNAVNNRRRMTGAEAAEAVLRTHGVHDVSIRAVRGQLTDHYDPRDNTIYLSEAVYNAPTIAAVGVAAHEAGHAVQYAEGYGPIRLRSAIVPATQMGSKFSFILLLIGIILYNQALFLVGIVLFAMTTLFQLITLPVEFNASHRAIETIEGQQLLDDDETDGVKKVLRAAALTYVAALLMSVLQLLRFVLIFAGRSGGNRRGGRRPMTGRDTALQVLTACRTSAAWADAALAARIGRDSLSPQDAALATRLVYGVLQNRMLLDFYLSAYCTQSLEHLQPPLADILRLGAYQILFLDKVPDSAAVNESVNLAKQAKRGQASGLVNAVLRKVVQNKDALPQVPEKDEIAFLSVNYSHPKWLVKRLLALLGREEAEAFLRQDNENAPLIAQVNPLKTIAEALTEELTNAGISVRPHPWVSGCLELSGTGNLTALPAFREGRFFVQDAAARLVTDAAGLHSGSRVVDVCAAPGGKSFSTAIAMGNEGDILSCDVHENKLRRIEEGAARLGLSCIRTAVADGREPHPEWAESADAVLVDAPCSGLGIIRKKPDIRYKKPDGLLMLPVLQTAILANAASYVKPGGCLIYSTCTILPEENEHVTDAFLAEHPDFSRESMSLPEPADGTGGQVTLWPQRLGTDGFYICRMKRRP